MGTADTLLRTFRFLADSNILDYLKDVLPLRNSQEQNLRLLGNILSEMNTEGSVVLRGKLWFACK